MSEKIKIKIQKVDPKEESKSNKYKKYKAIIETPERKK